MKTNATNLWFLIPLFVLVLFCYSCAGTQESPEEEIVLPVDPPTQEEVLKSLEATAWKGVFHQSDREDYAFSLSFFYESKGAFEYLDKKENVYELYRFQTDFKYTQRDKVLTIHKRFSSEAFGTISGDWWITKLTPTELILRQHIAKPEYMQRYMKLKRVLPEE